MDKEQMKKGFRDAIPIVVGYVPVAMAYGLMAKNAGLSIYDTALMSLMVFAGASQFMAVGLIASFVGFGEIIISTFLVNFRHFLMSASLSSRLKNTDKRWRLIMAFGVTDEVFSVASFYKGDIGPSYLVPLEVASYGSWVLGGILGHFMGQALPEVVGSSMGVALYAMFMALLIPEVRENWAIAVLAIISATINTILYSFVGISKGWSIVIALIVASAFGATVFKNYKGGEEDEG